MAADENLVGVEHADDTKEEKKAQAFYGELIEDVPSFGMRLAPEKCKVMLQGIQALNTPLTIQGETLEVVVVLRILRTGIALFRKCHEFLPQPVKKQYWFPPSHSCRVHHIKPSLSLFVFKHLSL
ncbi:hypothetical protein CLF_105955 [Clonorchis sinensis]|uniref:Uncharacterized protein n=1 Tax=Clonorchis sinensis TaxID=79923 RepID=G7YPK3_CLOSI|nr:hypothetical protein CLF_105955 [Clonorchis sinensis]